MSAIEDLRKKFHDACAKDEENIVLTRREAAKIILEINIFRDMYYTMSDIFNTDETK